MTLAPELRGPAAVRAGVTDFLRAYLPLHIAACRSAWGLSADALPLPVSNPEDPREDAYFAHAITEIDRWPMVAVTHGRRTQPRLRGTVDFDEMGNPVTSAAYPMRVYSWVRTSGREAVSDMRDNFLAALQVTLASHVDLGTDWLRLDPRTLTFDFSDLDKVSGDRWVAGSYVGFDLSATETLTDRLALPEGYPRDTVSGVNASGTPLPSVQQ